MSKGMSNKGLLIVLVIVVSGFLFFTQGCGNADPGLNAVDGGSAAPVEKEPAASGKYKDYELSGPYTHKNMALFLVHGKEKIDASDVLTLDEALEQKLVVVHETSEVDKLAVENKSKKKAVFIQSGDIVKGGKQDRVLRNDMVIAPSSGKVKVASFCVEQGRWNRRAGEDHKQFSSSKKQLVSKKSKLAAKYRGSQSEMWRDVAESQAKIGRNLNKSVRARRSSSSLQLSLEDKDLEKEAGNYVKQLSGFAGKREDTVGFVFAINGEINSADIYSSKIIFKKLWAKAIESCSIEAISELKKDKQFKKVSKDEVIKWLAASEEGKKTNKSINPSVDVNILDSKESVTFETVQKARKGKKERWLHKSYIKKSKK
jgi:hypothetical protein